jgi:hypothetical protein
MPYVHAQPLRGAFGSRFLKYCCTCVKPVCFAVFLAHTWLVYTGATDRFRLLQQLLAVAAVNDVEPNGLCNIQTTAGLLRMLGAVTIFTCKL